jgi:hypothetical protein
MTRYFIDEMETKEEKKTPMPYIPVSIHLMSGEVLTFQHLSWMSLYSLKQQLREYCHLWKPHLIDLYYKSGESEDDFLFCCSHTKITNENNYFYLIVKEEIRNNIQISYIYTYHPSKIDLYRFSYTDEQNHVRHLTFTYSNQQQFSISHPHSKEQGGEDETVWYDTVGEMVNSVPYEMHSLDEWMKSDMVRVWNEYYHSKIKPCC